MGMREEFSQAYHEKYGRLPQSWSEQEGKFFDAHANGAFWGWQASRAALCVELPCSDDLYGDFKVMFSDDSSANAVKATLLCGKLLLLASQAIESAGVKCK